MNVRLSTNPAVWLSQIEPLAIEAISNSDNTVDFEDMCEAILAGLFTLWIVLDDDDIAGFYVTEFLLVPSGVVVNVPFAGFKSNFKALVYAFNHAERVAKDSGAVGFKFISQDKRWAGLAKRRGFKPRFVEYFKEYK